MSLPGIATISLGRSSAGHDILDKIHEAARAGFHGIEIFFECLEHLSRKTTDAEKSSYEEGLLSAAFRVRQCCDRLGVEVLCLQPFLFYDGLTQDREHLARLDTLRLWFRICHALRTDLIQVPTNFQSDGTTGNRDKIVGDMREIALLGLQQTPVIRFAYEGISWGNHIDTWEGTWKVVQEVNLPNLGLCLDAFHIAGRVWADPTAASGRAVDGDEQLAASFQRLRTEVDPAKIFYIQIGDAELLNTPLDVSHPFHVEGQKPIMSWSRNARLFPCEHERGGYLALLDFCSTILVDMKWKGWISLEMFNRSLFEADSNVPCAMAERAAVSWKELQTRLRQLASTMEGGLAPLRSTEHRRNGQNKKKGVIYLMGSPISHSLSPAFNNTLWAYLGLAQRYERLDTTDVDRVHTVLRSDKCIGASVTMPLKASVMPYLDELSEESKLTGAVNTVLIRHTNGKKVYHGTNVDCIGIRDALQLANPQLGQHVNDQAGLVIGGGATARTAIFTLARYFSIKQIYIVNRSKDEVDQIVAHFSGTKLGLYLHFIDSPEAASRASRISVAISAIPDIAPTTGPELQARRTSLSLLTTSSGDHDINGRLFLDMCYSPSPETTLLSIAEANGWQTINGIEVLMAINWAQNVLWLETPIEALQQRDVEEKIRATIEATLKSRHG